MQAWVSNVSFIAHQTLRGGVGFPPREPWVALRLEAEVTAVVFLEVFHFGVAGEDVWLGSAGNGERLELEACGLGAGALGAGCWFIALGDGTDQFELLRAATLAGAGVSVLVKHGNLLW